MLQDDVFPASAVADHSVLLPLAGKLRGRRARLLSERLADLADAGVTRVVLDMRELTSLDSLGTFALEEGVSRGLRIHLVVRPSFTFEGFLSSRALQRALKTHHSLDEALNAVRNLMGSGLALV